MIVRAIANLLAASALLLAGCIEVTEEITINADGSGRLKFDLGIDQNVSKLAALGGSNLNPIDIAAIKQRLKRSENVSDYSVETEVRGKMAHTIVTCEVKDVTVDIGPLNDLASEEGQEKLDGLPKRSPFMIERLENGNFRFTQNLESDRAGGGEKNVLANTLLAGMFADRHLTVRVHGPIVSSNGDVAKDKGSVEWRIPIAQIANQTSVIKELEAEVSGADPASLATILLIFVIVLAIIIVALVFLRARLLNA